MRSGPPEAIASFDVETTGVSPETDRIVSAALVIMSGDGAVLDSYEWLLNPGVEIPAGATAVHGISTAHAVQYGTAAAAGIRDIAAHVAQANGRAGLPLVVFNAPFDLTMLDRECRRHLGIPLGDADVIRPVVDPFVLDKALERYRPGKRTLVDVCDRWGFTLDAADAHGAAADATAAGRLALRFLKHSTLQYVELDDLHTMQQGWKREQAEGLAAYHSAQQGRRVDYSTEWPLTPKE